MSRAEKMILAGTAAIVLLILILDAIAPREPNWNTSFTRYKTDPYACGLTYDRLGDLFPQGVTTVREPIYSTAEQRLALDSAAPRVNHIFIDGSFSLDDLDLRHLLMMVEAGDDAFIAAEDFYGLIQDTLNFSTAYHWEQPDTTSMAREVKTFFTNDTDLVRFTVFPLRNDSASRFARGGFEESFNHFPVDSTQVLAENQRHDPVLIRIRIGKGFLYLCSVPRAFTNYYLLKDEARPFMESAFSLLPNRPVLWDEYYKVGRDGSQTPLRYILEQPALRGAYWTAIALLLLTVLVYARRRQRAIPVVEPPRNTSREFADTMGRLYYFQGDHADIARKLSTQFKDETRRKLRLHRTTWDAETVKEIALRSGISEEELNHAGRLMDYYADTENVSEQQLLTLNKALSSLRVRL